MSSPKVRKAIFPVAGLGTRFLPATKSMPKEMLTVVDRPLVQWVVDEAREAGIEHFIFVTGRSKHVIEDHFDHQYELEDTLKTRGKTRELEQLLADMIPAGQASFTRQQAPLGLGHAVWCARDIVGNEPFAVLLPDVLVKAKKSCLAQMMDVYNATGGNVLAVETTPTDQLHQYGVVGAGAKKANGFEINAMVEKPAKGTAPSNYTITGRYILQPQIFDLLAKGQRGAGGEIQLTDAMISLLAQQSFYGLEFDGKTYDCGSKIGFLTGNVAYGLDRPELADDLRTALKAMLG